MKKGSKAKRRLSLPLRRPPRLSGERHKFGVKPIKKKKVESSFVKTTEGQGK